jgi:ABC-2 type transport system permease protein
MRRILAQIRKELTQIVRDRRTLALALLLPLVLLFLMSTAISLTATHLPIVVQDLDDSAASREFVDAFRASLTFYIVPWNTTRQPEEAFRSNLAYAALIVPEHFGRDLARGVDSPVQLLLDASDANSAKLVAGAAQQIARAFAEAHASRPQTVQAAIRLWYNPGRSSMKFFGPGIFVLGLSMFPPLLAALAMAKEDEKQTILQVYVSNISAHEFLLGKVGAFMVVSLMESLLMLVALLTSFGLRFAGDPTPFLLSTVLYAFCVAAFGTMVGAAIPSQVAAIQAVAFGGFLLVFLLSGLLFPIENIPVGLRWISYGIWGRYYIEIVRDALLEGGGWPATWYKVAIIGLIGGAFYLATWRRMRRMQLAA